MAYKTYARKRKTYRKKTPWYNRKYSTMQLAKKAWYATKYLKGLVNSEMHHAIHNNSVNVSTTATVLHLTAIGQDDTASGRTGNSVLLRNIFMRWGITNHAAANNTYVRIVLVQDKQQLSDTPPTYTDVFQSSSTLSSMSLATAGRFKILKDWFFILDSADKTSKNVKYYLNVQDHIRWNGTAGSDIQKNGIYLLAISDQSTNTPTLAYNVKLGWHDN